MIANGYHYPCIIVIDFYHVDIIIMCFLLTSTVIDNDLIKFTFCIHSVKMYSNLLKSPYHVIV